MNKYYELKSKGICPRCKTNKLANGKSRCENCLKIELERFYAKRNNGLCARCGNESIKMLCETCSKLRNGKNKQKLKEIKNLIFDAYGSICACCGEDEKGFLSIDHVNNDGAEFRKKKPGFKKINYNYYKWIVDNNFPKDLQLLCFNCNLGKALNGGICPHHTREDVGEV